MLDSFSRFRCRHCFVTLAVVLLVSAGGCSHDSSSSAPVFNVSNESPDQLRGRIDAVVDDTLHNRTLNTRDHNAWQIMHGILPYGKAFKIDHDGQLIPALQWLLDGGDLNGWELRPGDKGVAAELRPGSKAAQGHPDQWIGILSQAGLDGIHGLNANETLVVQGKKYTVDDMVRQGEWELYPGMESPWLIWALTAYRPLDYQWTAKDGQQWTFERLVDMDAGLPVVGEGASCGGTHRLYGLTVAVNRYMKETHTPENKLTGGWKKADDVVQDCVRKAREFQQPDGSFSTLFFVRPSTSPDVDTMLHATGHTLEWLDVALTQQQLEQPWVTAAVDRLCQLLEDNKDRALDCGALYHAIRGLRIYRERRFGPHDISDAATVATTAGTNGARLTGDKARSSSKLDDSAPPPPKAISKSK